jgi:isoleucyl-tRNA synthetase
VDIKIRQPLSRIVIPAFDQVLADRIKSVEPLVLSEVNVKSLVIVGDETGLVKKKLKPNFKTLGPKAGPKLKSISTLIQEMSPEQIRLIEKNGFLEIFPDGNSFLLNLEDVEIISEDLSGMSSATNGRILVALDISISESLRQEGLAREFVNRIQNFRKESGFEVTDRISVVITAHENWNEAVKQLHEYICTETLCDSLRMDAFLEDGFETEIYEVPCRIKLEKKKNG